jgi:hydroxymethylpyrimidine/phosphomethylpyrimidine kinase
VLSIAGFDPSAGAGVLADVKTFEQNKVMGLAVTTAITYQNEDSYLGTQWLGNEEVQKQCEPLFAQYKIDFVKIGLVKDIDTLTILVDYLLAKNPKIKIILDPILKATAAEDAFQAQVDTEKFKALLPKLFMITPNWDEIQVLNPGISPMQAAEQIAQSCHVYLKGGHRTDGKVGYDTLFIFGQNKQFSFKPKIDAIYPKHGTGCVVSAALLANLAKGFPLIKTCLRTKTYIENVLSSNPTKLGWHHR